MKNETKYVAEIEFQNGMTATARDNNLRRLKARIARSFSGEATDWGFSPTETAIKTASVFEISEGREDCVLFICA